MRKIICLLALLVSARASATGPQWLRYDDAIKAAKPALVLYGSENCPHVPPARKAFEAPAVLDLTNTKFALAYVDIGTAAGGAVAKRRNVASTPTLEVLGPDGTEVWRLTSPDNPEELVTALQKVILGESYTQQESLLKSGALGPEDTLTLANAYLDRGWKQKGLALLTTIAGDPTKYDENLRRRANFTKIEYAPRRKQLRLLQKHLQAYPTDMYALINFAHQLPDGELDKKRAAMRRVAANLTTEQDPDLKAVALRIIVQFVAYKDPSQAAWALPLARQRVQLDPSDVESLTELAALDVLARQPE